MGWHPDTPAEFRNQIVTGDARLLAERLPDESVDLIFTDPPYPKEYLPLYGWLAETAARVLKPGGLCVALCGHFSVLDAARDMGWWLEFFWLGGMEHRSSNAAIHPRRMWAAWKPMLWFRKPGGATEKEWTFDLWSPSKADKRFHAWGQPVDHAAYYVSRLSSFGGTVWEPFCGGGTVPAVCKQLGRNYVAFEIDPETAQIARERVRLTPEPLLIVDAPDPQPELEFQL